MIGATLRGLMPERNGLLMIENVGNLVCPALFDLGEQCKVVLCSVTEGEDKPLKYPHMFRAADLMLLNKMDLVPLHGRRNPVDGEVTIKVAAGERRLEIAGEHIFDMRDHGLDPPRLLMLCVHPEIRVRAAVIAEREE